MTCLILLLSVTTKMYGATPPNTGINFENVIKDFITCHIKSDFRKFNVILDDEVCLKIPRGEKVSVNGKSSLIDFMKTCVGLSQGCKSNYVVTGESSAMVFARVDFEYADWVQHNYIVLEKNPEKEWKITQICKINDRLVSNRLVNNQ